MLSQKKGHEMYAMYWLLLEALTQEFDDNETEFQISSDRLCAILRVKYDRKVQRFLQDLSEFSSSFDQDLFKFESILTNSRAKIYKIQTPIILELKSRDHKSARSSRGKDAPKNKELESELKYIYNSKDNAEQENKNSIRPNALMQAWNLKMQSHGFKPIKTSNEKLNSQIKSSSKLYFQTMAEWNKHFDRIAESDFLKGKVLGYEHAECNFYKAVDPQKIDEYIQKKYYLSAKQKIENKLDNLTQEKPMNELEGSTLLKGYYKKQTGSN